MEALLRADDITQEWEKSGVDVKLLKQQHLSLQPTVRCSSRHLYLDCASAHGWAEVCFGQYDDKQNVNISFGDIRHLSDSNLK